MTAPEPVADTAITQESVQRSKKSIVDRLFDASFMLTILVVSGFAFSLLQAEPDLWGHVQYGRDALREGLHRTTTYSFTAEGYRWINHENLSELLFATITDQVGVWGLLAGKCLLGLFIVGLIVWRCYRLGVSAIVSAAAVLIVAVNLTGFWYIRPQVLSYTLFATLIAMLSFSFHGWENKWNIPWTSWLGRSDRPVDHTATDKKGNPRKRPKRLPVEKSLDRRRVVCVAAAAILFIVWVNTHGAFLAGLCIFIAYVGLRAVEVFLSRQEHAGRTAIRLLLVTIAVAAATLINPYGFRLHAWLLESLTIPRPEIIEWHPLSWTDQPFVPFAILSAMVVGGLLFSRRSLDATQLVILSLTFWQAASHQRHIPFFVILCGFWMPIHWQSAWQRWESRRDDSAEMSGKAKFAASLGLLATTVIIAFVLTTRCRELPVRKDMFPVSAVEYLAKNNINGRMVVTYNWAQYAIAALGVPSEDTIYDDHLTTVSFDGRFRTCYPLSTVDSHFDFVLGNGPQMRRYRSPESGKPNPAAILELGDPDLVLISRKQPHSVSVMDANRNDWTLLYQDELAQVWGRQEKYGEQSSLDYLSPAQRDLSSQPQEGTVAWPALPTRTES